jgi:hypothetical protein
MAMNRADVQAWLDRYVEAWKSYDREAVEALFAQHAEYRYQPWAEPVKGRDAIVKDWLNPKTRDVPGTWAAHYEAYAVDAGRAVAIGETSYFEDASQAKLSRHYWNIWTMEFDDDGRCTRFVEYFMQRKT